METATGKDVEIRFDGEKCIHSRNCVLGLPTVFRANVEGPWIDPDGAPADEVLALARRCPSGAVVAVRRDGTAEAPSGRNVVAVLENGPYAVRGDLRLGAGEQPPRLTLCRCGQSKNKPYCDSSHVAAGFVATGELPPPDSLPAWPDAGPMTITPLPNGPLKVDGPHEVTCGSGRAVKRGASAFLCRCGASANRPFCDGSHRAAGFSAP